MRSFQSLNKRSHNPLPLRLIIPDIRGLRSRQQFHPASPLNLAALVAEVSPAFELPAVDSAYPIADPV